MSIAATLAAVARADAAAARAVLHNCRTSAFGCEAYGRAGTAALFRATPLELDPAGAIVTEGVVALFGQDAAGGDAALFADVHQGHVLRLWALAKTRHSAMAVDETGVPADLDLDQRGGRFLFDPADHPALNPAAVARLRTLGEAWIDGQPAAITGPVEHIRPVLLRAASAGARTAALIMLQGTAGAGGGICYAAGVLLGDETVVLIDEAGRAAAIDRRRVTDLRPRASLAAPVLADAD